MRGVVIGAERRLAATTALLLLLLAAAGWLVLGGAFGSPMASGIDAPLYLGSWLVMTIAMMVPATLPVLVLHRVVCARQGLGPLPTAAFLVGYLAVWSAAGVLALGLAWGAAGVAMGAHLQVPFAAGVLVVAGLYQLSPVKGACLRACRNPLSVLFDLGPGRGLRHDLAGGLRHGGWCLACCWSLMAVLVAVSAMNLALMAVLTVVFLVEKNHERGPAVARAAGVLLVLLGLAGLVHPELLTWLSGGMSPSAMGGGF